jgi:predicted GNAT superfamily acetyltransferase
VTLVPDLRPLRDTDVADVLALNEANVEMLSAMDEAELRYLQGLTDRFDVVDVDGAFGGFVVTMTSGTTYDSTYYGWFGQTFDRFYYLDRIVLHPDFRRRGFGGLVYDEIERVAAPYGRLCLEVNLAPRNDASLAFHRGRGFVEVGQYGDEAHLVSLMEKRL